MSRVITTHTRPLMRRISSASSLHCAQPWVPTRSFLQQSATCPGSDPTGARSRMCLRTPSK